MKSRYVALLGVGLAAAAAAAVYAQGGAPAAPPQIAFPTQNCTLTPAQIAANRKVALAFFTTTGDDRVALADPSYKQHNPVFMKRSEEANPKKTDFEEFRDNFGSAALAARRGGPGGGAGRANAPTPPGPNNQFEIVTTECDVTTVVHRGWRQDPVTPGRWFEAYTFDTFRVKDGKLVEHWDSALIAAPNPNAPAGAPGGGAPPARGN
jgi:predicted SnoaL-like aldol condensation-catalyzing enzyme